MLRISWVDSRFLDGRGLTTATLSVPIVRGAYTCVQGACFLLFVMHCPSSCHAVTDMHPPHTRLHTRTRNKRTNKQAPDFAENPFRQASLALEHTWQLPWPTWLDSAGDRMRRRQLERRRRMQQRTGSVLDEE